MGSGYGRQNGQGRQTKSLLNKALQADTASGLSARHRPHNKRPPVGRPRSENNRCRCCWLAFRRAGKWGECSGTGSHEGGCRPTYCPYPTYRLCLSLSLPTPLICTNPIWPQIKFFFFFFSIFTFNPYFPTMIRPLTLSIVTVGLT